MQCKAQVPQLIGRLRVGTACLGSTQGRSLDPAAARVLYAAAPAVTDSWPAADHVTPSCPAVRVIKIPTVRKG